MAETLNLGALKGYRTGGTLHIITNNQVGFTTDMEDARSTRYASDLAKGFDIPIIHVNADDAEACLAAVRLAMAYRDRFHQDVLIDLVGYRRHGHNEGDEPAYTQPLMYERIKSLPDGARAVRPTRWSRRESLTAGGGGPRGRRRRTSGWWTSSRRFKASMGKAHHPGARRCGSAARAQEVETALAPEFITALNEQLLTWPEGFTVHPKLRKQLERRRAALGTEGGIDWAHAEALALASLLAEGVPIRLTGQDTERGTFSQRHLVLHDAETGQAWAPIQKLPGALAPLELHNSPLSELATLGLRVRLQRGRAGGAGAVGGAVRRLHQRRAGHRGPVPLRGTRPSGGSPRGSRCCCRTATRARGRSTRARGWSGSSSSPPRATSGSRTRRRRRSTSTCCAARRGAPGSGRWW